MSNQEHSAEKIVVELQNLLVETPGILFVVLVGSRANGSATETSDWDIAIQWQFGDARERVAKHELLRHRLACELGIFG